MPEGSSPETRNFTEEELAKAEVIGGQYFTEKPVAKGDANEIDMLNEIIRRERLAKKEHLFAEPPAPRPE